MSNIVKLILILSCFICVNFCESQDPEIKILIIGKSGVGKSSLINYLIRENVALVSDDDTGTVGINFYKVSKYGYNFKIYDTPGLYENFKKEKIFDEIRKNILLINIVLICYDLSSPRLYENDMDLSKDIISYFGPNILQHSLIVYTKSNLVKNPTNLAKIRHEKLGLSEHDFILAYDDSSYDWVISDWLAIYHKSNKGKFSLYNTYNVVRNNYKNTNTYTQNKRDEGCFSISNKINILENGTIYNKNISEIKKGDYIESINNFQKVIFVYDHQNLMKILNIETENNYIKITPNHILYILRNNTMLYLTAEEILIGDKILTYDNNLEIIIDINYTVDNTKYFLIENEDLILVNNLIVSTHVDSQYFGKFIRIIMTHINNIFPSLLSQNNLIEFTKKIYLF